MNVLQIPINENLYSKIKELSEKENISIESFASLAIEKKIEYYSENEYFHNRFKNKTKDDFRRALLKVPSVEPPEYDRLQFYQKIIRTNLPYQVGLVKEVCISKDGLHLGKWSPSEENMRDVGHFNKKNIEEFK